MVLGSSHDWLGLVLSCPRMVVLSAISLLSDARCFFYADREGYFCPDLLDYLSSVK